MKSNWKTERKQSKRRYQN